MANPDSHSATFEDDRNPVDVLADEFANRIRSGETPSIDDYAKQHPKLAAEIRAVFPLSPESKRQAVINFRNRAH